MVIDFRHSRSSPVNTIINGQNIELVESYKYLGTLFNNKLTFDLNTDSVFKKSQQHLFCLRKLAKFQVDRTLMNMFYRSFVECVLPFSFICWFQSLNIRNKNSLSRVVSVRSKIIGTDQEALQDMYNKRVHRKAKSILSDSSHPLYQQFEHLPSGSLFRLPPVKTNRYKQSFIPTAVSLLNSKRKS